MTIKKAAPRHLSNYTAGPKAVGSFVPKLAQKAFEKFGFAAAAVLTDWSSIVGPEIAACTQPERLRWPRPADAEGAAVSGRRAPPSPSRTGATLMLRVEPSRALDVQYKTAQIIERINAYFGYLAVTDIRLAQAPLSKAKPAMTAPRIVSPRAVLKTSLGRIEANGIEDADLRHALERLGSAISAAPHRHG